VRAPIVVFGSPTWINNPNRLRVQRACREMMQIVGQLTNLLAQLQFCQLCIRYRGVAKLGTEQIAGDRRRAVAAF
jgi:hypothetical protein